MTLSELIVQHIKTAGITQEAFARRCGVSKAYMTMLIKNRNPKTGRPPIPTIETYNGIATALGMPLDELFMTIDNAPVRLTSKTVTHTVEDSQDKPTTPPDLETAAQLAAETLIKYKVTAAPVLPMAILESMPNVFVVSFTEFANNAGVDSNRLVTLYDSESQDVVTITREVNEKRRYIIAYNQRMPFYMIHRGMARELGHILLGHDRSQPTEAQTTEALYFLRHLLCPRPLIKALQDEGINLTIETVGNVTGLYGRSIAGMRETPGAHISPKMNRRIREQFSAYVRNLHDYLTIMTSKTDATPADFGTYMDNYEE